MSDSADRAGALRRQIEDVERESEAKAVAVAVHDTDSGFNLHYHADRWFHAASTIKVPILLGVFEAIDRGVLLPYSRVHVRNRFRSVVEGIPFRIESDRDANSAVHAAIGKTMRVEELAFHMIATSSNLATNLLLDLVGLEAVQKTLRDLRVADKTGDISTVAHDAGVVYLPDRKPYVVVVLTEWEADGSGRSHAIASISHAVY